MTQPTTPGRPSRSKGRFLRFWSWFWGIFTILAGSSRLDRAPLLGALAILLGIALLPIVRRLIGRRIGIRLAQPAAITIGVLILAVMTLLGRDIQAERKIEQQRQLVLEQQQEQWEDELINHYPFVDRDSLRAWSAVAADSVHNPTLRLVVFLERQEEFRRQYMRDSIVLVKQWRQDSLARARQWRKDSALQARETRRAELERERLARQYERESSTGTSGGRTIYIGPRGGKYYINSNGKKTYIH